jgi:hypothetical protein
VGRAASILNTDRSRISVGNAWQPSPQPSTDRAREINQLANDLPRYWDYGPFDAPIVYAALDHIRTKQPRVLYLMLGEGDEWAHEGRYDLYLDATLRTDRFIQRIWDTVQSLPAYANQTALIITTDHGRGATTKDWTDHGPRRTGGRTHLDGNHRTRCGLTRRPQVDRRDHVADCGDDGDAGRGEVRGRDAPAAPPIQLR